MYDMIILGAGPCGLTAALYAKRYGLNPLVLERNIYGGQIANTPEVENYPGIKHISGVELAMALYDQVTALGVEIKLEAPVSCRLDTPVKEVRTQQGAYEAPAVIIANGARRRKLGCPGEDRLTGLGVSYCATCDGSFFREQEVAIVGVGNTVLEDALFLANICRKVNMIHRRDQFRGNKILSDALLRRENIQVHYDSVPEEIGGEERVDRLTIRNVKTGDTTDLPVTGVFVAIGLEPDNEMFAGQVETDRAGYLLAGEDCKTNLEGVFAAGDTRTKALRQIVTAAADGAVAAFEAANYINSLNE